MYKVLDERVRNYILVGLVGLSAALCWLMYQPGGARDWVRVAFATPGVFAIILYVLGGTSVWRVVWRKVPKLNQWVFPDLNGEWATTMESNILEHAKFHPALKDLDPSKVKSTIPGRFIISQTWFKVSIRFDGDDKYSNSDTLFVHPERDSQSGRFYLTYTYKNQTPNNLATDEQMHMGAARLEVDGGESFNQMRGTYWTNRNWKKALNTAGSLVATRVDVRTPEVSKAR
ncbi:hypothetical protein ACFMBG_15515 [Leisingera sp. D0M16]|uniref:Cap15 family cyclic dinucleotide receptor domain-containing protein n=1 Tax=Leisingera coralii TaxID=3351347 RepID=UPI003B7F0FE0